MSLLALQRDFRGWLTDGPVGDAMPLDATLLPGLAVYHNAYRVQLSDCLAETFEQTYRWIGDDAFLVAARAHIEATPPRGWTLGTYGERFADGLAALYPDDPEVAELARLEWLLGQAFVGPNGDPLAAAGLIAVDWDRAVLRFLPTLRLTPCRTNAGAIWSALSADRAPPAAAPLPAPGAWLVWRQGFTPCFRTIETDERRSLAMLMGGATFGAMCASLVEAQGEGPGVASAAAMLGQWLADGLIADVSSEERPCG